METIKVSTSREYIVNIGKGFLNAIGEKIAEINQTYLTDFLTLLTYLIQKGEAEDEEDRYQEQLRKAKGR